MNFSEYGKKYKEGIFYRRNLDKKLEREIFKAVCLTTLREGNKYIFVVVVCFGSKQKLD